MKNVLVLGSGAREVAIVRSISQSLIENSIFCISKDINPQISFLKPVFVGNVLFVTARVNYVQNSSLEIEVNVEAEDIAKGTRVHTGNAFVTFVALDENGKPASVPKLRIETPEDQKRFEEGKLRMERRLKERRN